MKLKSILMIFTLAFTLARGLFAVELKYSIGIQPTVDKVLNGESIDFSYGDEKITTDYGATSIYSLEDSFDKAKTVAEGSVSVLPITGPIMKHDYCGDAGTKTMCAYLKAMDSNPNIAGHFIPTDSPGGEVFGTFELAKVIKNLEKPKLAFADSGFIASAAYLAISGVDEIWASDDSDQIGSVGVVQTIRYNFQREANEGRETHFIYSDLSDEKNEEFREFLESKGKKTNLMQKDLNKMATLLNNKVAEHRPNVDLDVIGHGRLYYAYEALENNLIDHIGNQDQAIARLYEMIEDKNKTGLTNRI